MSPGALGPLLVASLPRVGYCDVGEEHYSVSCCSQGRRALPLAIGFDHVAVADDDAVEIPRLDLRQGSAQGRIVLHVIRMERAMPGSCFLPTANSIKNLVQAGASGPKLKSKSATINVREGR